MKTTITYGVTFAASIVLAGCSTTKPCEDILEVKRQVQQCNVWAKAMVDNNRPQRALTARKLYESECENLRFYRDDYDTICKSDDKPIGGRDSHIIKDDK